MPYTKIEYQPCWTLAPASARLPRVYAGAFLYPVNAMWTLHGYPDPNTTIFLRGDLGAIEVTATETGFHGTIAGDLLAVVVFEHPARVHVMIARYEGVQAAKIIRCKGCRAPIGAYAVVTPDHDETWLREWLDKLQADDKVPASVRCRCGKSRRLIFKTRGKR